MNTASKLTKNQKRVLGWRVFTRDNTTYRIKAELRYDDECGNGHNTFSITGEIQEKLKNNHWREYSFGCLHDEIAEHFPEYAHLIQWHLTSTDGPMHYIANVLHFASDRDCWGLKRGEPSRFEKKLAFNGFPTTFKIKDSFAKYLQGLGANDIAALRIEAIEYDGKTDYEFDPKYTFTGFCNHWHECPFDTLKEAEEMRSALQTCGWSILKTPTAFSKGKERELDKARLAAHWPEATDEELTSPDLKEKLEQRLGSLLARFRADMEKVGFVW